MSDTTRQDDLLTQPELLLRVLQRMGLADGRLMPVVEPLTGGVSSSIFRVALGDTSYCMKQALAKLKVEKDWRVPVDRVFAEIAWLQEAGGIVPGHVPSVLGVDNDVGAFAMEYLPAADYTNWKTQLLAGNVQPAVAGQVGGILGRIHAATADRPEVSRRFATDANFFALRLEPYLLDAARQHPERATELVGLVYATQRNPRVLVHGDVSPKNILLGRNGPVLLDAECAWYGDPAFDLGFVLNHLLLKAMHQPAHAAALQVSFERLLVAYLAHVSWEPQVDLLSRTGALLPGLLLARVAGKSPVEYLGLGPREKVRAFALQALHDVPASPAEVLARFIPVCRFP